MAVLRKKDGDINTYIMDEPHMITLIGTGHVFDLQDALRTVFHEKQPDALCIELDAQRYHGLLMKQQQPEQYNQSTRQQPFLYRLLAQFQENMAKRFGVNPGEEMITSIHYARDYHIPLFCIDMHAQKLFTRMIKTMTFREKLRFFSSGIAGIFIRTEKVEQQVETISQDVENYLDLISKKFPTIKRILIDERNAYMVNNLKKINDQYQQIICVVGDGHIPGMSTLLQEQSIDYDVIRLRALQQMPNREPDVSTASFSVDYQQI